MTDSSEILPEVSNIGGLENEKDLDADMDDPQEENAAHPQEPSSSTLDHEPTQTETQLTTSLPHQNRKDTTLREFLSKMDDYAPIVGNPSPSQSVLNHDTLGSSFFHSLVLHKVSTNTRCSVF
jgi:hypothetical protein